MHICSVRKLTIEIFHIDQNIVEESVNFPLCIARSLMALLPRDFVTRFDENSEQLEELLNIALDPDAHGVIMELIDNDERVVISVS